MTPSLELGLAAPPPTHTHNHTRNGERRSVGLPGRALASKDDVYFPWFSVSNPMCATGAGWVLVLPFARDRLKVSWLEVDQGSDI